MELPSPSDMFLISLQAIMQLHYNSRSIGTQEQPSIKKAHAGYFRAREL